MNPPNDPLEKWLSLRIITLFLSNAKILDLVISYFFKKSFFYIIHSIAYIVAHICTESTYLLFQCAFNTNDIHITITLSEFNLSELL